MFESMLAKRYISTQKRHAVLTVCSIAIAIALMTMLFTALSTVFGCFRDIVYDQSPYHIRFNGLTKEEAETVAVYAEEYGMVTVEESYAEDGTYWVRLELDGNISSASELVDEVSKKAGLSQPFNNYNINSDLMFLDMKDDEGRGLMAIYVSLFYVFALFLAMTVRLVIDTAFEVSSKERERQFGVLQSIGATPKQIVHIITLEGLMLSGIGLPIGVLLGVGIAYAGFRAILSTGFLEFSLNTDEMERLLNFHINPWLLLIGVVTGALWVLLSAYGTGMRVIRMTPMQAISARSNTVKKVRKFSVFGALFGWTGKLASRNNSRNLKRFVITVLSLTLSITLFATVSVVVKDLRDVVEAAYELDYDFYAYFKGDPTKFAYREPLKVLQENDVFDEVFFDISKWTFYNPFGENKNSTYIYYFNESEYNERFGGNPPISYNKLSESGGYILTGNAVGELLETDSITLFTWEYLTITSEEYEALSPKEQEYANALIDGYDPVTGEPILNGLYSYTKYTPHDYKITKKVLPPENYQTDDPWSRTIYWNSRALVSTLDVYENGEYLKYKPEGDDVYYSVGLRLADNKSYINGIAYLDNHLDVLTHYHDNTEETRRVRAVLSAVEIGAGFLNAMFALIAIVNMVNILSTGILNRRGEIASMQCVGMTERQLYKMTFVECLQYALSSGVMALILCEALMFASYRLFVDVTIEEELGRFISYVQPIPRVLIAAVLTFAVALIASLIPLRGMRSRSLVEHIHSVE